MSLKELFLKWMYPNYSIWDVVVTFEVIEKCTAKDSFWGLLDLEVGSFQTVSIRTLEIPKCIRIHSAVVHYMYNGKMYIHMIDESNPSWPPKHEKFNMPIKNAFLCDEGGKILLDVTECVKMLMGPKNNTNVLERVKKLELVNVLGGHSSIFVAK